MVLETKRCILRKFEIGDAESFYLLNADPEVIKYTGDEAFADIEDAKEFLRHYDSYLKVGYGRWAVINKEDNSFIGWCGLKLNEEDLIDLGFRFFKKHWGNGFATETANACLNYGFEKLQMELIIGRAVVANAASIRVLEKIGMEYWKQDECHGFQEAAYYKITSDQYAKMLD